MEVLILVLKEKDSKYFFDGHKFADYIDVKKFIKEVTEATNIKSKIDMDLGAFYEHVLNQKNGSKRKMDKILFDNIFYSHLKNVFVCNIESHPNLQSKVFKTKIKELIKKRNHKDTVPNILYTFMSENGFYLMDSLNIKSINTKFIAGLDIIENNNKVENLRILFVEVASKNQQTIYYLSAIEINFKENIALVLMRNVTGLSKDDESNTTVHQLYNDVINKVFTPLNIKVSDICVLQGEST